MTMDTKLNIIVTAGGTREYIDDVRVLSNISTGRLGAKIAEEYALMGHNVYYVAPRNAIQPSKGLSEGLIENRITNDTKSVMTVMQELVPKANIVVHSMAVSDFSFDLQSHVKLSSNSPEAFIEHLKSTIVITPKVISNFRKWNYNAVLVGFKFTVGKKTKELLDIAMQLKHKNKLDMVFANDKRAMQKSGDHVGTLLMDDWNEKLRGKKDIAKTIVDNTIRVFQSKYNKG